MESGFAATSTFSPDSKFRAATICPDQVLEAVVVMNQTSATALTNFDEELDLGFLWPALRTRVPLILALAVGGVVVGALSVLLARPIFVASGSLFLGDVSKKPSGVATSAQDVGANMLFGGLLGGTGVETQVEILTSRDLVVSAITASGFNTRIWKGRDDSPPSVRWWRWRLVDGKGFNAWAPGPQALVARDSDISYSELADEPLHVRFSSRGHYTVLHDGKAILNGRLGEAAVGAGLRLLLESAHKGFVPAADSEYRLRIERAVHLYRELFKEHRFSVSTTTGGGGITTQPTLVVELFSKDHDPYKARRFLKRLMDAYLSQNLRWSTDQAAAAYRYLDDQLNNIRDSLGKADERLADYKRSSGVIAVSAHAKAMIKQLATYQTKRSAAELRLYNLRQISNSLDDPTPSIDSYLLSSIEDKVLDSLSGELAKAETKLASLAPQETVDAPEVVQVKARINRIKRSIRDLIHNEKSQAEKQVRSMDGQIDQFEERLKRLPEAELKVAALTRSSEVLGKLYMFLLQKQEEAAIRKAGAVSNNRVLDKAATNEQPVSPAIRTRLPLGLFIGLFVGLSWSLGRAILTPGFRSENELRKAYPSYDWYALLPHLSRQRKRVSEFSPADPRSDFGEAIRTLRGNVYLSQRAGHDRTWMISSATPGDGKSTVACELAVALAYDGKKVVLVDADIRKPHAHEQFNVLQTPGLTDVLTGRAPLRDALRRSEKFGFDVLPGGPVPPNPAELMGDPALNLVVDELAKTYEYVLLDTAPFPLIGDGALVARHVDRVLSVVRLGHTPRNAVAAHLRSLAIDSRAIGLVVNDLGGSQGGYGYGYGYGDGTNKVTNGLEPFWRKVFWWKRS